MQRGFAFSKLADRLVSMAELAEDDLELLTRMPCRIGHFATHDEVVRPSSQCCLLLEGYLCWTDRTDGQITSISVPGDVPDLQAMVAPRLQGDLKALRPAVVAFVPHTFFQEISHVSSNIHQALQLLSLAEAACLRNWIVNLGSRDSMTRVAHLFCEIVARLRAVGLAKDGRFAPPFTQSDLASACAISAVHANRTIQELRRRQVLEWRSQIITITDWQALSRLARFEPSYLGLRDLSDSLPHQPFRPSGASEDPELTMIS
jgi:CRP-like cAMP-binding protein